MSGDLNNLKIALQYDIFNSGVEQLQEKNDRPLEEKELLKDLLGTLEHEEAYDIVKKLEASSDNDAVPAQAQSAPVDEHEVTKMSKMAHQGPLAERFELGIVDEYGKLRVLVGKHLLTINCLRYLESVKGQCECCYNCSHFSGPQIKDLEFVTPEERRTEHYIAVKLLCSGRTLYFKKFINALAFQKSEVDIDFKKMSAQEIADALGIRERPIADNT